MPIHPLTAMTYTTPLPSELEQLAQRRTKAKLAFLGHALIYALVITGLSLWALSQDKTWSLWPAAGWGLGLLMHGLRVFGWGPGTALREHMLERERAHLRHPS